MSEGAAISIKNGNLIVPEEPLVHYIEGDGIGIDITPVMINVVDAAVEKAYSEERKIHWNEVLAGQKAFDKTGEWLPEETLEAMRTGLVSIKGPLTTPVGGGIRSLNVALRQKLDLFACVRPVRWYEGTPSPVRNPEHVNMIIFRENSEDVYAGIEWEAGSPEVKKVIDFLQNEMGVSKIRFPETSGIGIKPISSEGTSRIVRAVYCLRLSRLVLYYIVLSCLILSYRVFCCFVLSCFVLACIGLHCLALSGFILYCLVLVWLVLAFIVISWHNVYCLVLCCLVLSCIILFCVVLCCLVLSCLVAPCLDLYRIICYCLLFSFIALSYIVLYCRVR